MLVARLNKVILLALLMLPFARTHSQGLAAFSDFRDHFYVFDNGIFRQLEHMPVTSFQVGKWGIAYKREDGTLMIYHNGHKRELTKVVKDYQITEGLLVYTYGSNLFVYNGREKKTLTMDAPYYKADADIVAYYDRIDKMFKVYYKGEVFDVESALSNPPVSEFKVGDNILAYRDPNDYLNAYFEGSTQQLMPLQGRPFYKADKNLVAYYDVAQSSFKLHHVFGKRELGFFRPASFKVSDNRVVFVENSGDFMVYEDDRIKTLSTNTPSFYRVHDSILVYEEQNHLKVYYDGQIHTLENFIPDQMKYGFNTLAYLNERSHLRVFRNGEVKTITYEQVNTFEVFWDVVWFNVGMNSNKVYYNGRVH